MPISNYDLYTKTDWNGHVPAPLNEEVGDDLSNLTAVTKLMSEHKLGGSEDVVLKKCWDFVAQQPKGADIIKYGEVLKNAKNLEVKQRFVKFNDGEALVNMYELRALKKDYPHFSISNLSNISAKEFKTVMDVLFRNVNPSEEDAKLIFKVVGNDLAAQIKYGAKDINVDYLQKCPLSELPNLMVLIEKKYPEPDAIVDQELRIKIVEANNIIKDRIDHLNPKNREDVKAAADMYTALVENDLVVNERIQEVVNESLNAKKDSGLTGVVKSLVTFLSHSLLDLFAADRKFVIDVLKDIPNLKLEIKDDISSEMADALAKMENLISLTVADNKISREDASKLKRSLVGTAAEFELKDDFTLEEAKNLRGSDPDYQMPRDPNVERKETGREFFEDIDLKDS